MRYFLVQAENKLEYLSDFRLFRSNSTIRRVDTFGGSFTIPDRREPDHFMCSYPAGSLPRPFLVVDKNAQVFDCAANVANLGQNGFLVAGVVLNEYEAPEREEALKAIAAAVEAIPNE